MIYAVVISSVLVCVRNFISLYILEANLYGAWEQTVSMHLALSVKPI